MASTIDATNYQENRYRQITLDAFSIKNYDKLYGFLMMLLKLLCIVKDYTNNVKYIQTIYTK